MKPMNFPARKLVRQLRVAARVTKDDDILQYAAEITSARAVRTKIKRPEGWKRGKRA